MDVKIRQAGLTLLCFFVRLLLSLRYSISVKGLGEVRKKTHKHGVIFLPNHPAEIDPVILMALLWKGFYLKPLVVEHFYYVKWIHGFMKMVGALPLPTIEAIANTWKAKRVEKMARKIKEGIERGENFLIYPSGRLKLTNLEVLGGSSLLQTILQEAPQAQIVLVRTTGLWGSLFSRALTGSSPDFLKTLKKGVKILLKNGIFFAPRRKVTVEFALKAEDFPSGDDRAELNRYLERWYNVYPESISLVSFSFMKKEFPEIAVKERKKNERVAVPPHIEKEVLAQLAALTRRPVGKIQKSMHLAMDLSLDSLDLTQLYLFLDEKYGLGDISGEGVGTVEDLLQLASGSPVAHEETKKEGNWEKEKNRPSLTAPGDSTLTGAFLSICDKMKNLKACSDHVSGTLSYAQLKRSALILSLKIREMKGEKIGIMLPSSVSVYVVILATLLTKKVPVMLNWTAGVRALEHAVQLTDIETVISSMRFLGRKEMGDLGSVDEKLLFLEDIRFSISTKKKLLGFFLSFFSARSLLKKLKLNNISKDECAAILFTSGTESLPKGVPLSHDNLLSNHRAALARVPLKAEDRLLGALPPFHSFGFSISGLLPLLSGMEVAFSPDPTDSHALASDIFFWKPTLIFLAPTFYKALFRAVAKEQMLSIRLFVTGAEKAPAELFDQVEKLHAELLEGYGITECGPIVALNDPSRPPKGVGAPLSGISLIIIHPETAKPVSTGEEGEICIAGPNVFHGYLGARPSPFVRIEGRKWYRSGDLGRLDQAGNLFLSGRMKRFMKIGGEMISLGGLEEELVKIAKNRHWIQGDEEGPKLAIAVKEKEGEKPLIVLITTFDADLNEINQILKETGFGRLVKIAEIKKVEEIPLTGTGKTHYRLLDEICN